MARTSNDPLDDRAAVDLLRTRLPEFAAAIDEHLEDNFGELLFHLLMGDLARFYVSDAIDDPALRRRFWMVVDRLAVLGDDRVENAVAVSLIERFAWGSDQERSMLVEAKSLMSSHIRAMADDLLRAGGYDERGRPGAR